MSNYWNLLCRTCDDICGFEWNHGGDFIKELIPHLPLLAEYAPKLEPLREILDRHIVGWEITFPTQLVVFARLHHAHELIPVDEYGNLYGACGSGYRCSCCSTWVWCKKPDEHDGDHGPAVETSEVTATQGDTNA